MRSPANSGLPRIAIPYGYSLRISRYAPGLSDLWDYLYFTYLISKMVTGKEGFTLFIVINGMVTCAILACKNCTCNQTFIFTPWPPEMESNWKQCRRATVSSAAFRTTSITSRFSCFDLFSKWPCYYIMPLSCRSSAMTVTCPSL